jgi:RNA polymerase sigma-70 factor (ECF subfamily)
MDELLKLETETFNKLYTDYRLRFIRFAQTYIPDTSMAEDVVMEALEYYWEHRKEIRNDESIPSYLLTVIKHKCLNYLRQERFHIEKNNSLSELALWELDFKISALSACDPYELYRNEVQELVINTLKKLSPKTRQIFLMNRYGDLSYPDIAKHLAINQKTVEYHISKVLKLLRSVLKDYLSCLISLI